MKHAIEILEERELFLRALMREIGDISDRGQCAAVSGARWQELERQIAEVREALRVLRLQTVPAA